ncbi:MAG: HAD-IC family P-type ATPase, partial [Cyanobacteria bacterium REEB65]|nr:HAD-IC family P-type ATPase [Cyanobacteria bacterium REEB65]
MATDRAHGLTGAEAEARLERDGPNAVEEERPRLWLALAAKFWAPIPWMLEAAVVLELVLGKRIEAGIIGALLLFNATLAFFQEKRAQTALSLLRQRLEIRARVLRDGQWQRRAAREIVVADVVYLRTGDMVPADIRLDGPDILLDQSTLTGEALPVEAGVGEMAYAGTLVKRGEAIGEVVATGRGTRFGRTAELVRTARTVGHLQRLVFTIVKALVSFNVIVALGVVAYSLLIHLPSSEFLPFAIILLVAAIPVALPATFTLASALGALDLAGGGVLVPHLAAIEEAAALDVLCCDKTGTITQNHLTVGPIVAYPPFTQAEVLRLAAMASDPATQDPLDLAILHRVDSPPFTRLAFIPFDPATKRSEAVIEEEGGTIHVAKGAHTAIAAMCHSVPTLAKDAGQLASHGYRILAVAVGTPATEPPKAPAPDMDLAGLLAFEDPPRDDSAAELQRLKGLGVRVLMLTGDSAPTARSVAEQVGIGTR